MTYEVRRNLELLLEHLRPLAPLAWSPSENFHITTKFIGEWPDERVEEIVQALTEPAVPEELSIALRGFGWLPNPHHPRLLFAGVAPNGALQTLAAATDRTLQAVGIAPESHPYQPHVTLARVKGDVDLSGVRKAIATLPSADFGVYRAAKHLLYRSRTGPSGSIYSVVAEFPLP